MDLGCLIGDLAVHIRAIACMAAVHRVVLVLEVLRLAMHVPLVCRLDVAGRLLLGWVSATTVHHVHIAGMSAHVVHLLVDEARVVLVRLVHTEPLSVLICQLELGLIVPGINPRLLDALAHILPPVLLLVLVLATIARLILLDVAKVVRIE